MPRKVRENERKVRSFLRKPGHPFAGKGGIIPRARLKVEAALGQYLHPRHVVHHVDKDYTNDDNSNLVVCEDRTYHKLIHKRMNAKEHHGSPNAEQCTLCLFWDLPEDTVKYARGSAHRDCINSFQQSRAAGLVRTRQEWREQYGV